jgi:hypothetical protein
VSFPHKVKARCYLRTVIRACSRWLALLVVVAGWAVLAGCAVTASGALGRTTHGGPLTGTWSGYIAGDPGSGVTRHHIVIVVNAKETGGTWKISAGCHGSLTLDSISNGYHHFLRKLAHGSTCAGCDIDCLKPAGANVYDSVTSHRGGEYDASGTLRRVRRQ